jgi:hypothetical protein
LTEIFISHMREDNDTANRLALLLQERGLNTWIDEQELLGGQSIANALTEAINAADAVVVLLSDDAAQSAWVSTEIAYAVAAQSSSGRPLIIPVLLQEDVEIPVLLRDLYAVGGWSGLSYVADAVARAVHQRDNEPAGPRRSSSEVAGTAAVLQKQSLNYERDRLELQIAAREKRFRSIFTLTVTLLAIGGVIASIAAFLIFSAGKSTSISVSAPIAAIAGGIVAVAVDRSMLHRRGRRD